MSPMKPRTGARSSAGAAATTAAAWVAGLVMVAAASWAAGRAAAHPDSFSIQVQYVVPISSQYDAVFQQAIARWKKVITGTHGNSNYIAPANTVLCRGISDSTISTQTTVADLLILVKVHKIDGVGNVLGQSAPCRYDKDAIPMPRVGWMELDVADVAQLYQDGQLNSVITHEMGHILGIGTSWSIFKLTRTFNWLYYGKGGIQGLADAGGKGKPLIENKYGLGTAGSHWREKTYRNELMTGFISGSTQPLSTLTAESLEDLGYLVDKSGADVWTVPKAKTKRRGLRGLASDQGARRPFHSGNEKPIEPDFVDATPATDAEATASPSAP